MILQSAELPETRGATGNQQNSAFAARNMHAANCQEALDQMRYRLYMLDRSQRRPSIEDCMASLLESSGNKLPA